jgi:hypothetical protein
MTQRQFSLPHSLFRKLHTFVYFIPKKKIKCNGRHVRNPTWPFLRRNACTLRELYIQPGVQDELYETEQSLSNGLKLNKLVLLAMYHHHRSPSPPVSTALAYIHSCEGTLNSLPLFHAGTLDLGDLEKILSSDPQPGGVPRRTVSPRMLNLEQLEIRIFELDPRFFNLLNGTAPLLKRLHVASSWLQGHAEDSYNQRMKFMEEASHTALPPRILTRLFHSSRIS